MLVNAMAPELLTDNEGGCTGIMKTPMDTSYDTAMEEWELVAFNVVAGLLDKLGLKPTDVSINCLAASLFTELQNTTSMEPCCYRSSEHVKMYKNSSPVLYTCCCTSADRHSHHHNVHTGVCTIFERSHLQ